MKSILFIRESDYQFYCANQLYKKNVISHVIIEEGESLRLKRKINLKGIIEFIKCIFKPKILFYKIIFSLFFKKYFGNTEYHNQRVLGSRKVKIIPELIIKKFKNINDIECLNYSNSLQPKNIYVFGIAMIKKDILRNFNCPIVNLHWGIAPFYRGEGIVSSLANKDFDKLGVTIHKVIIKSDAGDIYQQKIINIDKEDNFYSISLKMTYEGTKIFIQYHENQNKINFKKQNLKLGKLYSSKFFKKNYKIYFDAYKNLAHYKYKIDLKKNFS